MIKCEDNCKELCDFCIYQMSCGRMAGRGYCIAKDGYVDWCDSCTDDFHCFRSLEKSIKPNFVKFMWMSYAIFFVKGDRYDKPIQLSFKERFSAWVNLVCYALG